VLREGELGLNAVLFFGKRVAKVVRRFFGGLILEDAFWIIFLVIY